MQAMFYIYAKHYTIFMYLDLYLG